MTAPVLDLAYGRVTCGDGVLDVLPMLEEIDSEERRGVARSALIEVVRRHPWASRVLVPTVWGPVRTAAMVAELRDAGVAAEPLPRAVAIAASHADAAAASCLVVETSLLPSTGGHWSAHLLVRRDGEWTVGTGEVTLPGRIPVDPGWARLAERADAVFVDGPDPAAVQRAVRVMADAFGVRADVVDREVLAEYGGRTRLASGADLLAGLPLPPVAPRKRSARAPAVVAAMLLVAAAGAAAWTHWPRAAVPAKQTAQVGSVTVEVPGAWRRTDQQAGSGGQRVVFAAPGDGRRVIVAVSRLRSSATRESVAQSLRNRIAQRGDDAVAEFSADLEYAGRRVIGYRENPVSGAPVAWYVVVDGSTQVSVGCQPGTGEVSIDEVCRAAVGSAGSVRE